MMFDDEMNPAGDDAGMGGDDAAAMPAEGGDMGGGDAAPAEGGDAPAEGGDMGGGDAAGGM